MHNRYQTPTSTYESTYRLRDDDDDLTCRTTIEDSTFDVFTNFQGFSVWLANLDYYFNHYRIFEECRVWFARI